MKILAARDEGRAQSFYGIAEMGERRVAHMTVGDSAA